MALPGCRDDDADRQGRPLRLSHRRRCLAGRRLDGVGKQVGEAGTGLGDALVQQATPDRVLGEAGQCRSVDGSRRGHALVLGCGGNRSNTRRLAVGSAGDLPCFTACRFFVEVLPTTGLLPANMPRIIGVPGRMSLLNGCDNRAGVAFA